MLVLFLKWYNFLDHLLIDDCNGYRIFPIPEVILQIQRVGITLHQDIVLVGDIFNLIFFRVLDHEDDKVTVETLFDLFNLLISEELDVLGPNVGVHI